MAEHFRKPDLSQFAAPIQVEGGGGGGREAWKMIVQALIQQPPLH